jgi:hypothetical protein
MPGSASSSGGVALIGRPRLAGSALWLAFLLAGITAG